MGRGEFGNSKRSALCLSALFLTILLPLASASGGGAVIDVSTFSLEDFATTDQSTLELDFSIQELLSSSADVEVRVELSSLDGNVFDSMSQNLTLSADSTQNLQFSITSLPYGYTVVGVELFGELGSPNSTQAVSINRTLHRLQPIQMSLATEGQILLNGLTPEGALTGNVSLHDGDYLQTEVAVINDGDYSWSGHLTASLQSNGVYDNQTTSVFTVAPLSSTIVLVNSTISLHEGAASIALALNDSGDGNSADESRIVSFQVAPPPLPVISLSVDFLSLDALAGETISWNLTLENSGSQDFDGGLLCSFGSQILFDSSVQVSAQSLTNQILTSTSRPNLLSCSVSGMRIADNSISAISYAYDVESAAFESAGSTTPALLNGPWHKGDMAVFSMLVRNHGELSGKVALVCETNGQSYVSEELFLEMNAAGEVTVELPLSVEGEQTVNWSLSSPDGSIDSGLNGTVFVPVEVQQTLAPLVHSVTWDAEYGVQFAWSLEMSDGIDRPVRIRLGYVDSGLEVYPLDYEIMISEGILNGSQTLGFIDADRVSIRTTPVNWSTGFGFSSHSLSVPDARPSYSIEFNPLSIPNRPVPGDTGSVNVLVTNLGDVTGSTGYLVLSTEEGTFLGEVSTTALESNSQSSYAFSFIWPDGQSASLKVTWVVGEESFDAANTFQSGEVAVVEESFKVPWFGLLGGVLVAVAVGAVIRIYQNRQTTPTKSKDGEKAKTSSSKKAYSSNVEKIQIGCPECGRQLRVPSDYGGQVRCPDCETRFEVTPRGSDSQDEPESVEEEVTSEESETETDGKVEIHCPECQQSLRIPVGYAGSVRCPACEEVFSAVRESTT